MTEPNTPAEPSTQQAEIDKPYLERLIDRLLMPPAAQTESQLSKLHQEAAEMLHTFHRAALSASKDKP